MLLLPTSGMRNHWSHSWRKRQVIGLCVFECCTHRWGSDAFQDRAFTRWMRQLLSAVKYVDTLPLHPIIVFSAVDQPRPAGLVQILLFIVSLQLPDEPDLFDPRGPLAATQGGCKVSECLI